MSRKRKPKTPEQIAAERQAKALAQRVRDFEAVGLQPTSAALQANENVVVTREGAKTLETARRADAFDALRDGMMPGAYDAARRLERDMRIRRGEQDKGRPMGRVDNERPLDRTDAAVQAGQRVDKVLGNIGERDAWLLSELIYPHFERTWREVVYHITGETHAHAQGAAVRCACANLRYAYEAMERPPIERLDRVKEIA